jgi:ribonuclease Z
MKLVFFGYSGGIQLPGVGNVSFAVSCAGASLLVDVSGNPTACLRQCGMDPCALDALILSHEHPDHLYAFPSLLHNLWLMKREKPLVVIANRETARYAKALASVFGLLERPGLFPLVWKDATEKIFQVGSGLSLELVPVNHPVPTVGVKVMSSASSVFYSSDTGPFSGLAEACRGCGSLIHEASGLQGDEPALNAVGHSSARQAADAARAAGVERLFLCHLNGILPRSAQRARAEARTAFRGRILVPIVMKAYEA